MTFITVTVVREPVQMVTSLYGELRRHGPNGHLPSDLARSLSFERWCRCSDTFTYWCNPQARLFAYERTAPSWPGPHEVGEGDPAQIPEPELQATALERLETIDVVGTTGQLLEVYKSATRWLGVQPRHTAALRLNVGDETVEVAESTSDRLAEHNAVDASMFQRALQRGQELDGLALSAAERDIALVPDQVA